MSAAAPLSIRPIARLLINYLPTVLCRIVAEYARGHNEEHIAPMVKSLDGFAFDADIPGYAGDQMLTLSCEDERYGGWVRCSIYSGHEQCSDFVVDIPSLTQSIAANTGETDALTWETARSKYPGYPARIALMVALMVALRTDLLARIEGA